MDFQTFKENALRTESRPERLNYNLGCLVQLLTAGVMMAKLMDTAKKTMFYGKPLDQDKFRTQVSQLQEQLMQVGQRIYLVDTHEDTALHCPNLRIAHGAIGMFGESGELLEALLKQIRTGELDLVNTAEELGDSDWYKAIIHDETAVSEEQVREKVIAKLKQRYGDKFSSEAALNRDLAAERAVLENTAA